MTVEDLIAGLMAAISAGTLAAFAILAAPPVLAALSRFRRAP